MGVMESSCSFQCVTPAILETDERRRAWTSTTSVMLVLVWGRNDRSKAGAGDIRWGGLAVPVLSDMVTGLIKGSLVDNA